MKSLKRKTRASGRGRFPVRRVLVGVLAAAALAAWGFRGRAPRVGNGGEEEKAGAGSELVLLSPRRIVEGKARPGASEATAARMTEAVVAERPEGSERRLDGGIVGELALTDPENSGWESERWSERAAGQLAAMKAALKDRDTALSALGALLTPDCRSARLVPETGAEVGGDGLFRLSGRESPPEGEELVGREAVAAEIRRWGGRGEIGRLKFKVVGVAETGGGGFETLVLVSGDGRAGDARWQEGARWMIGWQRSSEGDGEAPLIGRIALVGSDGAVFARDGGPLFVDQTAAVMAGVEAYGRQFLQGNNHWARVIPLAEGGALLGYNGLAVGDADGDGLDDVYVPDGGGLPNRLLQHREDGTVVERAAEAGVDWLEQTVSALFVDLDNDGDQDLVAAASPFILIMENDGGGEFRLRGAHRSAWNPFSLAAADYDGDRLVDIYLCNYSGAGTGGAAGSGTIGDYPFPYTDANNGMPNVLLRNLGGFGFRDVTGECGLGQNNRRFSQAASWADYDGDGDPDLYVANDFGRNNLYRNDAGAAPGERRFTDVAGEAGVEDQASGMSVAWGDYDRDGRLDLYVSNMFSAAGNRVTYQARFAEGRGEGDVGAIRRMARGNTLFRGGDGGRFEDVSEAAGVTLGRWAWASLFADLDNDGWEDLVVANGYLTNDRADDL